MLPYRKCVAIILRKENLIFSAERLDVKGAWQLPQGGVEEGEDYIKAAGRELFEETGVSSVEFSKKTQNLYRYDFPKNVQDDVIKKYGKLKYRGQEMTFVVFDFFGNNSEINLKKTTPEFFQWKWETPQKILDEIVPFKKICYQEAFMELSLLT